MALLKDPAAFPNEVLGYTPWSKQVEVLDAIRKHRRVAIKSGHGTGKTRLLGGLVNEWMCSHQNARVVCTASTNRQVHTVLWAEVQRLYREAKFEMPGELLEREWRIAPSWRADAVSVDDPTALQGIHGPATLIVVDEAEGVDHRMWGAIDSLMSSGGSRLVMAYNPTTPSGFCYDAAQRPDLFHTITISCLDHPNVISGEEVIPGAVTRQWVDEVRAREGDGSPVWSCRVLGEFPKTASNTILTIDDLVAADVPTGATDSPRIGLDVARFGTDQSVLCVVDATRTVVEVQAWQGEDLMATAGRLRDAMRRHNVEARFVGVDATGIGAGVVDRLREDGIRVSPVDFGAAPVGDWGTLLGRDAMFANRKAELHWVVRGLIRQKSLRVPVQWKAMWADLAAPTYAFDGKGRITIESKDALRERLKRSPDHGDALVIAFGGLGTRRPLIQ